MFTNKKSFIFVLLMIVSSFSLASKLEVDMAYEIIYGNQKGKIDFSANICKEYKKEFSPSYIPNTFILDINKSIYNGIFKCTFINSNDLIEYKFNPLTEQSFNNNTIPSFAKEYIDFNNFNKDSLDIMVIYDHRDFTKNEIEDRVDDFKKIMNLDPLMVKRMRYNRFIIGKKDQTVQGDFVDYSTQKIKISKDNIQVYSVETSPDVCNILVEKIVSSSCKYEDENKTLFKVEF